MNNTATRGYMDAPVFASFDAGKPVVIDTLVTRYGEQYESTFLKMCMMGREKGVPADGWSQYEDNWYHETLTVKTAIVGGTGVGAQFNLTLDIGSELDTYAKVGDVIYFYQSDANGWISNVDSSGADPIITVIPFDSTDELLPTGIDAGTSLSIVANAHGQGTDQPEGSVSGFKEREFQLQIVKTTPGLTGSQFARQYWFPKIDNNQSVVGWYTTGTLKMEYYWKLKLDGALMVGQKNNNVDFKEETSRIFGTGTGKYATVKTTDGMITLIRARGEQFDFDPDTFDVVDLDDRGEYLRSQGVTSGYVWTPMGSLAFNGVQEATKEYAIDPTADGATLNTVISSMAKGNKEVATSLNFTHISRGYWTYGLDIVEGWSNPKVLGNAGYNFNKKALFLPFKNMRDAKTGKPMDNLTFAYRQSNEGYSRRAEVWNVAGAGAVTRYQTSVDRAEFYMRGECGLGMMAVNQLSIGEEIS